MNYVATTDGPLVSVVIPCYNQAEYLGEAIGSVLTQSYTPVEIIVVNDGSTDDTARVASSFSEVTLINQENRGLSAARNSGIRSSHGSMLVFLDADDRLLPEALSAGVACLTEHPDCAFAYGQYQFINADGELLRVCERKPASQDTYLDFLRTNRIGMHATVTYRRWVFNQVGMFNTSLAACEDFELYLRIVRCLPVVEHSGLVAEYRRHSGSLSSNARRMIESAHLVLDAESRSVASDPTQLAAINEGQLRITGFYAIRLILGVLPPHIKRDSWRRSLADLWWLLRSHPASLIHMRLWLPHIIQRRSRVWGTNAAV